MAMDEKKRCGPHTELAKNATSRITRCGCGQVHLHFMANGVTLQVSTEKLAEMLAAMNEAAESLRSFSGESGDERTHFN